jgi:GrpB-like predicted nucleotidyltransferase (UPF0157 family)
MLDEPIEVVPYRAEWPAIAAREIQRLARELGPLVVAFEHFGSTSVPRCEAKPILDILVGVPEWPPSAAVTAAIEKLGYENCGEAGVPGRLYMRARGGTPVNLAVTLFQGPVWRNNLLVRDLLRSEPQLLKDYINEKHSALRAGCNTLLSYSRHKAAFMERLLERARERFLTPGER